MALGEQKTFKEPDNSHSVCRQGFYGVVAN